MTDPTASNQPSNAKPVVLITGCSSGIGKATALRLARTQRFTVVATARKTSTLEDLAQAGCTTLALDVNDEASMNAAVAGVRDRFGRIDALVNNAGYSQSGAIEAVSMAKVRKQFETNVFGLARMIQLVMPVMRGQGSGRIVNISSMGGKLVFPGGGYYHATKYAVEAISDALRFEVKGFGVDVVVVEPGLIKSSFADAVASHMSPDDAGGEAGQVYGAFHAAVAQATQDAYEKGPLAKLAGSPDDVAAVIEKALTAKRPRPRYTVTPSAKLLLAQRKLLSDRAWDAFLRTSFPTPKPGEAKRALPA